MLQQERKSSSDYITEMTCRLSLLQCAFNLLYFLLKEHLLCYTKVKIIFCYMPLFHKTSDMNHFGPHAKRNFLIA